MFNIIFIDRFVKLKCSLNTNTEKLFDTLFMFPPGIAKIEVQFILSKGELRHFPFSFVFVLDHEKLLH